MRIPSAWKGPTCSLPDGAQIDRLSMDIGGKMTDAELMPADKARAYYEEIVRKMKDPALLEYAGRGAFRLRIYPIEPRAGKRVRITYTQLLRNDAGLVEYVYPLATEKFSSTALKDVSVRVSLDGKLPLKSVLSPTHSVEIKRTGDTRAVVGWEGQNIWPDTDFKLIFSRSPSALGIDLDASRAPGEDGYFMLLASPGNTATQAEIQPKDVCFVLDTSGSMAGVKLDQAKGALRYCLASLGAGDRFEIIRFSTEAEELFGGLVPADASHRGTAASFVDGMRATGGTAIGDALAQALALRGGAGAPRDQGRPYIVVFLTDGLPTVGETSEDALVASVATAGASTRIFSFGIGTDVNTHLLDRIAASTRAASQYVLPGGGHRAEGELLLLEGERPRAHQPLPARLEPGRAHRPAHPGCTARPLQRGRARRVRALQRVRQRNDHHRGHFQRDAARVFRRRELPGEHHRVFLHPALVGNEACRLAAGPGTYERGISRAA